MDVPLGRAVTGTYSIIIHLIVVHAYETEGIRRSRTNPTEYLFQLHAIHQQCLYALFHGNITLHISCSYDYPATKKYNTYLPYDSHIREGQRRLTHNCCMVLSCVCALVLVLVYIIVLSITPPILDCTISSSMTPYRGR